MKKPSVNNKTKIIGSVLMLVCLMVFSSSSTTSAKSLEEYSKEYDMPVEDVKDWLPDLIYTDVLKAVEENEELAKVYGGAYWNETHTVYCIQRDQMESAGAQKIESMLSGASYVIKPVQYSYSELTKTKEFVSDTVFGKVLPFDKRLKGKNPADVFIVGLNEFENKVFIGIKDMTEKKIETFKESVNQKSGINIDIFDFQNIPVDSIQEELATLYPGTT